MSGLNLNGALTRRRVLVMGAGVAGGWIAETALGRNGALGQDSTGHASSSGIPLEAIQQIEQIIQAKGSVTNGVYSIGLDRKDVKDVTLHGVPISPAFQINGSLYFQPASGGNVAMNSDMVLKAAELDPFIHQLLAHNITFQAEHQHFYDFSPMVWFIHFRAMGNPQDIAKGVKAALNATSTPFPQTQPANPTTPLPAKEMGDIIGVKPSIGAEGIVKFKVPRAETMRLGGMGVSPYLNIATAIGFHPYGGSGNAAAVSDFGMLAAEVNSVVGEMQKQSWDIGCLYNQETDEHPQLYFSHVFKTGDALQLAKEIRAGLNRMNVKFL